MKQIIKLTPEGKKHQVELNKRNSVDFKDIIMSHNIDYLEGY